MNFNIFSCLPKNSLQLYQEVLDTIRQLVPEIEIHEGIENRLIDSLKAANSHHKLLILDDLGSDAFNSHAIKDVFVKWSNHSLISIIFSAQNFFDSSTFGLTIRRNVSAFCLFNHYQDRRHMNTLAQTFSKCGEKFIDIFEWLDLNVDPLALKYVVVNCGAFSSIPPKLAMRSLIFPEAPGKTPNPVFFMH